MTPIFNPKNNCYYKELQGLTAGFGPAFFIQSCGVFDPWNIFSISYNCVLVFLRTRVEHRFDWLFNFCFSCRWVKILSLFVLFHHVVPKELYRRMSASFCKEEFMPIFGHKFRRPRTSIFHFLFAAFFETLSRWDIGEKNTDRQHYFFCSGSRLLI